MRGLASAATCLGAASCASSVTNVSKSWLCRSGLASLAAKRPSPTSLLPIELNSTSGRVWPASRMRAASVAPSIPGMCMSRMARSKELAHENLQRLLGRFGVLNRHAPLGRLQCQDLTVGGIVVHHQDALALQRRLRADEVAPRALRQIGTLAPDCEMESAAVPAARTFDPDRASHQFRQLLADRQAQPGAAVLARGAGVGLRERLEEAALALFIQPDAGIAHGELQLVAFALRRSAPLRPCR